MNDMKYQTHNEKEIDITDTHGRGDLTATYGQLVELFGEPMDKTMGFKTDAEWVLEYENGAIVTIYNWKNGKNYCGDEGLAIEEVDTWSVGGNTSAAPDFVDRTIASGRKPTPTPDDKMKDIKQKIVSSILLLQDILTKVDEDQAAEQVKEVTV